MKSSFFKYCLFLAGFPLFFACNNITGKKDSETLRSSTGGINELIVALDKEQYDSTAFGDSIREIIIKEFPGLPVEESFFKIIIVNSEKFDKLFKYQKKILFLSKTTETNQVKHFSKEDVWAEPQQMVFVNYPDETSLFPFLRNNIKKIYNIFRKHELSNLMYNSRKETPARIKKSMNNFSTEIALPKGFEIGRKEEDFIWFVRTFYNQSKETQMGVWVSKYPYLSEQQLLKSEILKKRDTITKKYIHGAVDGSYMQVTKAFPTVQSQVNMRGKYAIITRGMWELENDFMAGTFINMTTLDDSGKQVIMVDGYLYAPNQDKAKYMVMLEAIIKSARTAQQ